ncbi:MAG: DHA2 family efflux MFS transporter permease subunit [Candidatus Schekmanbacteria bacterium]|nr:MAG: DHA2 family efflux MFS transporter permease subunit [Candidatus Schekmanbacteria bacterium]
MTASPKNVNKWLVAVTVIVPTFIEIMDTSVANVSLNHIRGSFSASVDEATWVLTSYLVSNAIILPITGWLSSVFGRKRFLSLCVFLFALSSFLCGMSPNLGSLVFFRVLQGLGGGALQPLSQAILLETFPVAEHGVAMAAYGIGVVVAPIIGPLVGGWVTDNLTWRWIFYINIPVCVLSLLMIAFFIFDPPYIKKAKQKIDYFGLGFLAVGLGCLQIVLDKGEREDWFNSDFIITLSIIAVAGLFLFVITELFFVKDPVVNLKVFKDISFTAGNLMMFFGFFGMFASIVLYPIYLQTVMGYTATLAGIVLGPGGITILLFMPITGILMKYMDARKILVAGLIVGSYAVYLMSKLNLEAGFYNVLWPRVVQGVGVAFFFVPLMTVTMSTIPKEEMGNATGVFNLLRNLGGSFGTAFVMTMLARRAQYHQSVLVEHLTPYDPGFMIAFEKIKMMINYSLYSMGHNVLQGLKLVYAMTLKQAMMLSFCDLFYLICLLNLVIIPLAKLLNKTVPES